MIILLSIRSSATVQWSQGDFNLDDKVTGDDYAFIDANLGKGTVAPLGAVESTPVVITTGSTGVTAPSVSADDAVDTLLQKKRRVFNVRYARANGG